jgi:hypothetical protein
MAKVRSGYDGRSDYTREVTGERILHILLLLSSRTYEMKELITSTGLCKKTISRYMYALERLGIPIVVSESCHSTDPRIKSYSIARDWARKRLHL